MAIDYSLYLVTDSTQAILGDKDIVTVVEQAIEGGVTIVQYRDKTSDTGDLIRVAKNLHSITSKNKIPLIINDRVDVALAVGAEGVHIGNDDMDLATAQRMLGPNAIIGVTCNSIGEARAAATAGASYLGIGTMFANSTKMNSSIIGVQGTRAILEDLATIEPQIKTVAIGGIKASNVQRVLFQSRATTKGLDGVAVVSAIVGATDPKAAAAQIRTAMEGSPPFVTTSPEGNASSVEQLLEKVPGLVTQINDLTPLCHNMTNLVVQNFAANVALAIGASPIMANYGEEAADLARIGGSLVINMGTVTPDGIANYMQALKAYNAHGGPVLFDPVGAGATQIRRDAVDTLLNEGYFDVIKGNENEITTIYGQNDQQQKGVDAGTSTSSETDKAQLVKKLAARHHNIVVMTGVTDYLSDGNRTYTISNGSSYLAKITGAGCVLGTTIAAYLSVLKTDKLLAALTAILVFEIASEQAAARHDVKGPGTFVPALLDELHSITDSPSRNNWKWLTNAKVKAVDV